MAAARAYADGGDEEQGRRQGMMPVTHVGVLSKMSQVSARGATTFQGRECALAPQRVRARHLAVPLVWAYYTEMVPTFGADFPQQQVERRGSGHQERSLFASVTSLSRR
jgi:hypothetical protein